MPSIENPNDVGFQSRFLQIDSVMAAKLVTSFATPLYLFDLPGMDRRFVSFQAAARKKYEHSVVAISYKTNPLIGLLRRLHRHTDFAEVVSSAEYQLARRLGVPPDKIVFNGPAKNDDDLRQAIQGGGQINCDHPDEIDRVEAIAMSLNCIAQIGIRVALAVNSHFSRFGFTATRPLESSEAFQAAERIYRSPHLCLAGLHSHTGTNIRDLDQFSEQSKGLAEFAALIRKHLSVEMQWINVGGGLAGIATLKGLADSKHSLPCVESYCDSVVEPLAEYLGSCQVPPKLFFEPGRTIFDPFGGLLMTVLGKRPRRKDQNQAIICDAGITSLSMSKRFDFPIHFCGGKSPYTASEFFGPTCMKRDHIASQQQTPDLGVGDHLICYGIGGYCLATASSFINFRAGVVGWSDGDQFEWLRKPETLEHSLQLQADQIRFHDDQSLDLKTC